MTPALFCEHVTTAEEQSTSPVHLADRILHLSGHVSPGDNGMDHRRETAPDKRESSEAAKYVAHVKRLRMPGALCNDQAQRTTRLLQRLVRCLL